MKLPNLIIGGAPKSGTSSLYFWLSEHPDVFASKVKETFFFNDKINKFNINCNCIEHDIHQYSKFFARAKNEKIIFEATAAYIYSNNALKNLSDFDDPPKIIFLLREPSQQIYSHYKMENFRTKRVDESFSEYSKRDIIINRANYYQYLKNWYDCYPNKKIKLILYEDLIKNKKEVLFNICDFLEIDKKYFENFDFQHRNKSIKIKSKKLHNLSQKLQPYIPHAVQKLILPIYLKVNSSDDINLVDSDIKILEDLKHKFIYLKSELSNLDSSLNFKYWE